MCLATEKNELREDMLKQDHHEKMMRNDVDYFCEWVLENYRFYEPMFLFDAVDKLREVCFKYEHDFSELCDFVKGS